MNILLIQGNEAAPAAADQAAENWFVARYGPAGTIEVGTVTTRDDTTAAHNLVGIDLIVLGPNTSHTEVATKYTNKTVPALTLAFSAARQTVMNQMVGSTGNAALMDAVYILTPAHPAAGGFPTGNVTIFTSDQWVGFITDNVNIPTGATIVAYREGTNIATIWAIEVGGALGSGAIANSRQMVWGPARDFNANNANYDTLLEAAVDWLVTPAGAPVYLDIPAPMDVNAEFGAALGVAIEGGGITIDLPTSLDVDAIFGPTMSLQIQGTGTSPSGRIFSVDGILNITEIT